MNIKSKIAFVGLSHLGLVTSIGTASFKKTIIAVDNNKTVIDSLKNGIVLLTEGKHILHEAGLQTLFEKIKPFYLPSTSFKELSKANTIFITVDTPTDGKGSIKHLNKLIVSTIPYLSRNVTLIIMSQVPIGFCHQIKKVISQYRPNLKFTLYHWVDTIVMTNALDRFLHPERIIIGKEKSLKINKNLSEILKLFKCPVFEMSYESAEITKAFINLYLANTVTFANTLSDFCEANQGDINQIIPALQSDKRIGLYSYLKPTLSIAGGHIERDLLMINKTAAEQKISLPLVSNILRQNDKRFLWLKKKLDSLLKKGNGKSIICLWGLAYKRNSSSTKNAASLKILKYFANKYLFRVYDPMAIIPKSNLKFERLQDKYQAAKNTDCLVILTDWEEFKNANPKKLTKLMRNKNIIDAVGSLSYLKNKLRKFNYQCIGIGTD